MWRNVPVPPVAALFCFLGGTGTKREQSTNSNTLQQNGTNHEHRGNCGMLWLHGT
jgi:hypothetical protein